MEKPDFYKILCSYTPEELNSFISAKGSQKMVNAITFIDPSDNSSDNKEDELNACNNV